MRSSGLSLIGVLIGCAFAGVGLLIFSPRNIGIQIVAPSAGSPGTVVMAAPSLRAEPMPVVRTPTGHPIREPARSQPAIDAMPRVIHPGSKASADDTDPHVVPATMPNVIGPAPPPGAVVAGTGFFIAGDGTVMTASHVVHDCRRIRIVSTSVHMTDVQRLAEDRSIDVALLRAPRVHPPAILALAASRPTSAKLFVLGYPATANLRVPDETWATLENARLPTAMGQKPDTRQTVWLQSYVVTHGYSGGPMYDPRIGAVAGIVKAGIEPRYANQTRIGIPAMGLSFGPGAAQLAAFVHRAAPELDLTSETTSGGDALDVARRATVHVLCWR